MIRDDSGPCPGPAEGRACARCPNVAAESLRSSVLQRLESRGGAAARARRFLSPLADRTGSRRMRRLVRHVEGRIISRWLDTTATTRRFELLRELLNRCDVVISPSRFLADMLRRNGLAKRSVEHLDYGIPLDGWRHRTTPSRLPLRFGYLSTVVPHKGIEVALAAFDSIPPSRAELEIRGWGPSDYVAGLRRRWAHRPNIHFREPFAPEDAPAVFERLDALVLPSLWYENAPLLLHEAAAAGVPVVASDFGAIREFVVEGTNGLLFRRGDAHHLRRRISELIVRPEQLSELRRVPFLLKSIEQNAVELEAVYLAAARARISRGITLG